MVLHRFIHTVEVVVGEDVIDRYLIRLVVALVIGAIDIHVQVARRVAGNGERLGAVVGASLRVGTYRRVGSHGEQRPLEQLARELNPRVHTVINTNPIRGRAAPCLHFEQREGYRAGKRTSDGGCRGEIAASRAHTEVVNLGTDGEEVRPRRRVTGVEGLAVVHSCSAGNVEVVQLVADMQFLVLVLGYHVGPGLDNLVLLLHLVAVVQL